MSTSKKSTAERLSHDELVEEVRHLEQLQKFLETDRLAVTTLNPTQMEFINSTARETALAGPNQTGGKTWTNLALCAMHATGAYWEVFKAYRWRKPIHLMIGGVDHQRTRDVICDRLFGPHEERGTGLIPARFLPQGEKHFTYHSKGQVKRQIDYVDVLHETDGVPDGFSRIFPYSFAGGYKQRQGYPIHEVFVDEEPPFDVFTELRARLGATRGYLHMSFCPMQGRTKLYQWFAQSENAAMTRLIEYGIRDCTHLPEDQIEEEIERWKLHPEAPARLFGRPVVGEGLIWPIPAEDLWIDDFAIPSDYGQIIGIDVHHSITGVFAATKIAINPRTDTIYVIASDQWTDQEIDYYASRLRGFQGDAFPVAWPHDAARQSMSAGSGSIARQLRTNGINCLKQHAHVKTLDGKASISKMPMITEILDRMRSGRFRVFRSCQSWMQQKEEWMHRDGKVADDQNDHQLDATIKAYMMRRHAKTQDQARPVGQRRAAVVGREFDFYTI